MPNIPNKAFILAAGRGERLRPITETIPKPLVPVHGKPMIDWSLDKLIEAGVEKVVVNTHYLGDRIESYLLERSDPEIIISREEELLDTGGGILKALRHFDNQSFFVLSGDGYWQEEATSPVIKQLCNAWDPDKMDILMLLQPVKTMTLTKGVGDYDVGADGRAVRRSDKSGQYMFTSIRINHPRIFEGLSNDIFSYLELLDKAEQDGRLYALIHLGDWHHISTPEDLRHVNENGKREVS